SCWERFVRLRLSPYSRFASRTLGVIVIGTPYGENPNSEENPGGGARLKTPKVRVSPPPCEVLSVTIPIWLSPEQLSPDLLASYGETLGVANCWALQRGSAVGFSISPEG